MQKQSTVVTERVERGVAFLNERFPGWLEKIDIESLDISCYSTCIMGQLVGSYSKAFDILGSNGGLQLGFEGSDFLIDEELTEAWKEKIVELRVKKKTPAEAA